MERAQLHGLLLVDKPSGCTSHDVVEVVRRRTGIRRIGHTGTLDPMARGLLILLIGQATKRQQELQSHEKTYDALMRLGAQTDTADAEGRVIREAAVPVIDPKRLTKLFASLVGPLSQRPPAFSAVKVQGRPAYWWARRQRPVPLKPRTVQVYEMALRDVTESTIAFRLRCSSGTYVRAIAELVAERLGTVGYLSGLIRLRIGTWSLDDASSFAWLSEASPEAIRGRLMSVPAS